MKMSFYIFLAAIADSTTHEAPVRFLILLYIIVLLSSIVDEGFELGMEDAG